MNRVIKFSDEAYMWEIDKEGPPKSVSLTGTASIVISRANLNKGKNQPQLSSKKSAREIKKVYEQLRYENNGFRIPNWDGGRGGSERTIPPEEPHRLR